MHKFSFQPLKIRRLSETIEESIKDLITAGELEVGSKLPTEKEISRQFGVSVVTVREALRGLEAYGIIEKKRGKDGGIFVTDHQRDFARNALQNFLISQKFTAEHLNEVRRIIEPVCAGIVAGRINAEELKDIEANIKYCENKIKSGKSGGKFTDSDFLVVEERTVEFHRLLGQATHNPVLLLTVDYIEDFLVSFKKSITVPDLKFSIDTVRDHRRIYNALKAGQVEKAEQEMLRHVGNTGAYLEKLEPGK